jgi:hypothetical protein
MAANRLVVAAAVVVLLVAAADALRGALSRPVPVSAPAAVARPVFVRGGSGGLHADGDPFRTRVLDRSGHVYLSKQAIAEAFPRAGNGPTDVEALAVAPGGTLVLGVRRFPLVGEWRSALELWRGRRLAAAVPVSPGAFAGGLAFSRGGRLVAALDAAGRATLVRLPGSG